MTASCPGPHSLGAGSPHKGGHGRGNLKARAGISHTPQIKAERSHQVNVHGTVACPEHTASSLISDKLRRKNDLFPSLQ